MAPVDRRGEPPEEDGELRDRARARLDDWLDSTPNGGPIVIATIGAGLLLVSVLNYVQELGRFGFRWPQVAAMVLSGWLSAVLVYGALYLARSDYSARQRWQVVGASLAGLAFVYLVTYFTVVVRLSSGVSVGRPLLQLLTSAYAGAIAGLAIGLLYVTARQDAADARRTGERLEFMHSILRHDVLNSMTVVRARAEHLDDKLDDLAAEYDGQGEESDDFADLEAEFEDSLEAIVNQAESVIDLSRRARATVNALGADVGRTPKPVDLSAVLREEVSTVRSTYDDLWISAVIPDDVVVLGDDMLAEVLGNLIGNAIQHNDADVAKLRVAVSVERDTVTVRIEDNGPGIDDDRKEAVFERGHSTSGGGFGLFFVAAMVEHYGGDVWIEDNDPRGSVFVVELQRTDEPVTSPLSGIRS